MHLVKGILSRSVVRTSGGTRASQAGCADLMCLGWALLWRYTGAVILVAAAIYLFFAPLLIVLRDLREPALHNGEMPVFAYRWHRSLTQRYESWARQRVAAGTAAQLRLHDISGTEWPLFSSVYYLWATEALQDAWQEDPSLSQTMPKEYAVGAIEAAAALISDPDHAAWVKAYWGDDYLQRENIFYRMLLISGLTSYQKLLGDDVYQELLLDQVQSLARELDESPYGLLDDYPGECYPIDVLPAIAAIQRADAVLGTDHSESVARAMRGFVGSRLDSRTGLPAYVADSKTGRGIGPARGVGVSYMLIWAPELWPETAETWYVAYDNYFWHESRFFSGVREFSRESAFSEWLFDIDAGPVVGGYGTAGTAFGIGAARTNGRMDQAYSLSSQALVAAWPLPDGTLLAPRLLSNLSDAPYTGEAALLFVFTRRPLVEHDPAGTGKMPFSVYLGLLLYAGAGTVMILLAAVALKRRRGSASSHVPVRAIRN
jgi:hypothetical protein